ncbi:hypothetical protein Ddye_010188 [Dipteronia dyeriana]|uniref:AAA+ ATPase domain-containing protein n=1 Tax=Dipteronia dyeriana TaxID=168575 RepID=A0AAD9XCS4_9ROSI|nr:hypothetical protein Ddye_010188 [Dipteronia dyeriana]
MASFSQMPQSMTTLFSLYASYTGSMMLLKSIIKDLLPESIQSYICNTFYYLFTPPSTNSTLIIDQYINNMSPNQVYEAAEIYLRTKISPQNERLKVSKTHRQKSFSFAIEKGDQIHDSFHNIKLQWRLSYERQENNCRNEKLYFELTFPKKHRDTVMSSYLDHVLEQANEIEERERVVKLYSRDCGDFDDYGGGGMWGCINLDHPVTFDKLAMDPAMKKMIVEDLDRFVKRKEFYKRVGKAWKRGYLLYGPPGTGKSSLIAAMANYLRFDIYDVDLASIRHNSELRRILLSTSNRSILIIEDIDCNAEVQDREDDSSGGSNTKLTLSAILNFIDGLCSSCGDERIVVFTTNHKDRIDPALLRPGRMDVHINMSYCSFSGFRLLASNYLEIKDNHSLFGGIEGLIQKTEVTPAEVAEELMKTDDADVALQGFVNFLKQKRGENANQVLVVTKENDHHELSFMASFSQMPQSMTTLFSLYASYTGAMMLLRSIINDLLPQSFITYICNTFYYLFTPPSTNSTLIIDQYINNMSPNQVYEAAEIYLRTKISPQNERLKVSKTHRQKSFSFAIEKGDQIHDSFHNIKLQWRLSCESQENNCRNEKLYFELTFPKKHRDTVMSSYLDYVLEQANEIEERERVVKLYSRDCGDFDDYGGGGMWGCINLDHPVTFDKLAMDPAMKKIIVEDLDRFVKRKEFYKRVGKAWKRGYLLYGPPGTGKSSLIAAMANYLRFDIYDLDLASIYSNSELRRILLSTSNRSILIIEDIDCNAEVQDREDDSIGGSNTKVSTICDYNLTLSGILNFIDGLWSSCGDERILVFTTNHKDRIDPALLRPGRMDVHINMSYCSFSGFKLLASNYLEIKDNHSLFGEIEGLIQKTEVTPAEVAEELMKTDDADVALQGFVNFLEQKRAEKADEVLVVNKENDHHE